MKNSRKPNSKALLTVSMTCAFALLAACSNSGENDEGSSKPSNSANPSASVKPAEPAKRGNISVSIYDRGNIPAEEGSPVKNRWTDYINQNGPANVTFVPVPRAEAIQKLNALFAAGSAPDLVLEYTASFQNQLYTQKQLMPLDDVIEKSSTEYKALLKKYPILKKLGTKEDGKLYGIGVVGPVTPNHVLYVRADWLKKLNLAVPQTTEELYQVIKAFVERDPDSNGKKDTFGINLSFVGGSIINAMYGYSEWKIENGQYKHAWNQAKAATAFKKRLYDDGLTDKDFLTDKNGQKAQQDFINGKLGLFGANAGAASALGLQLYESFKKNNPDGEMIPIPLPKSEFGQFSPALGAPVSITGVVNVKTKEPAAVFQYIDFVLREAKTMKYGVEGTHYKKEGNGCAAPINAEKNQKELSWNADYQMFISPIIFGECAKYITQLNLNVPTQKEFYDIAIQAEKAYVTPDRPLYYDIDNASLPAWPQELLISLESASKAASDIWSRAIVSGAEYSIEKAADNAKAAWDSAGGAKLDEFIEKWYSENKDSVVHTKDWYSIQN
ncbi:MAG: extracellular solute-binding protein [Paenibacillus sp.]|jgi:putative aldouronate transport system substrate-binding protein|nr:extracellular solute-binding protein [Paenibacillus sp.]